MKPIFSFKSILDDIEVHSSYVVLKPGKIRKFSGIAERKILFNKINRIIFEKGTLFINGYIYFSLKSSGEELVPSSLKIRNDPLSFIFNKKDNSIAQDVVEYINSNKDAVAEIEGDHFECKSASDVNHAEQIGKEKSGFSKKMKSIISIVIFVIVYYFFIADDKKSHNVTNAAVAEKAPVKNKTQLYELISAKEDEISPYGELADLFNLGSDGTDLQRSEVLKGLKGKIIKWNLTVYEINKISDDKYRVHTNSGFDVKMVNDQIKVFSKEVSAVIVLTASSDEDKMKMLRFKTGSKICIKGVLTGDTSFRMLEIKPAVLCSNV